MNIQVQLCGLLIMLLLFFLYKSNFTLGLYTEKIFYQAMCISTLCLALDIVSVIAIYYKSILPLIFVKFICKSYNITLVWATMYSFVYVLTDLFCEKKHIYHTKIIKGITFLESIFIYFLPISIYSQGRIVYTYGIGVIFIYVFVTINILSSILTIIIYYKKLNKQRALVVSFWMLIYHVSGIIQFINNELLIVGFAIAMGCLILFVAMENPAANLDKRIGCFNTYALSEYINKQIEQQNSFCVLEISVLDSDLLENQGLSKEQVFREIVNISRNKTQEKIFNYDNTNIIIASENIDILQNIAENIIIKYATDNIMKNKLRVILLKDALSFSSMSEMLRFFNFLHQEYTKEIKGLIHVDDTMISKYYEKFIIEELITEALKENRVEVFFQPIYSNEDESFTSAEALMRIRQTDGSLLSPGIFIPVAEENGQIIELGERVFEIVCKFIKENDLVKLGIHYIEVNLSVIQCQMTNLSKRLISIAEEYQINPSCINLEITETGSISSRNILLDNMEELIKYGFSFSLDDFGKGESNLMYVVDMPVSIVKLDYDMSKSYFNTEKAKYVVSAVVSMAHNMNLKLVAEGIETLEELNSMKEEGIDYIQGYYYSKPVPTVEFIDFIEKHNV